MDYRLNIAEDIFFYVIFGKYIFMHTKGFNFVSLTKIMVWDHQKL
jgi:hypothetical protein